jgi:hypothetical protein
MELMIRCLTVAIGLQLAGDLRADEVAPPEGRMLVIDVTIVEVAERSARVGGLDSEAPEKIHSRVKELEKQGLLAGVTRVRLSAMESHEFTTQISETTTLINEGGPARGRGGFNVGPDGVRVQNTISRSNDGTRITVTPRIETNDMILLDFQVEKSGPSAGLPEGMPPRSGILVAKSALRLKSGQLQIANVVERSQKEEYAETVVFVTARIDSSAGRGDAKGSLKESVKESRVFRLNHARSTEAAKALVDLMADTSLVIKSDAASNSVLASGTKEQLRLTGEVIKLLDAKTGE